MRRLLLLRHTAVSPRWAGVCYGRRDVGLGAESRVAACRLAAAVPVQEYDRVLASPLRRARLLGGHLARRRGVPLEVEPRLAERDFGAWEGVAWDAIWRAEGSSMDGMLDAPESFRPGDGETTAELAARALAWLHGLPAACAIVGATHGGPIAALAGGLLGQPARAWLAHVPPLGGGMLFTLRGAGDAAVVPWSSAA